jgi:chondroitin sulfate synthase
MKIYSVLRATGLQSTARIQKLLHTLGFILGFALSAWINIKFNNCSFSVSTYTTDPPPQTELLLVGVMTANHFLETRAKAVFDTWGQKIPGKTIFFTSKGATPKYQDFPLVEIDGVDDRYPPMKKFYKIVKNIYDNYGDKFEWFMRADDDVYIRPERLEKLLRSLNSSEPHYIGQMGQGTPEDLGRLSLSSEDNFCMGGSGFIISKETLKRIGPNMGRCIKELYSRHDDVEIGRCIKTYANVSCTWAFDVIIFFF